jgi:hypothetical protein
MRNTPSRRPGHKTLLGAWDQDAPSGRNNSAGRSGHEAVQSGYTHLAPTDANYRASLGSRRDFARIAEHKRSKIASVTPGRGT